MNNMKRLVQLTDKVYLVKVPDGAESCEIRGAHPGRPYPLLSFYGEGEAVELLVGEYQILVFNTGTATEEQARMVVRELPVGARWMNYSGDYPVWYHTAKESLRSLLRSKGLDNKNYALIEKQSSDGTGK